MTLWTNRYTTDAHLGLVYKGKHQFLHKRETSLVNILGSLPYFDLRSQTIYKVATKSGPSRRRTFEVGREMSTPLLKVVSSSSSFSSSSSEGRKEENTCVKSRASCPPQPFFPFFVRFSQRRRPNFLPRPAQRPLMQYSFFDSRK